MNEICRRTEDANPTALARERAESPTPREAEHDGQPTPPGGEPTLGQRGEAAAALFLERRGYEILERNWRCPAGEADIVAESPEEDLVFVEVKTRSGVEHGFPSEAVTPAKRRRYEKIAGYYLADNVDGDARVRFDVIGILAIGEGRAYIRHHQNAFAGEE